MKRRLVYGLFLLGAFFFCSAVPVLAQDQSSAAQDVVFGVISVARTSSFFSQSLPDDFKVTLSSSSYPASARESVADIGRLGLISAFRQTFPTAHVNERSLVLVTIASD